MASIYNSNTFLLFFFFVYSSGSLLNGINYAAPKVECETASNKEKCQKSMLVERNKVGNKDLMDSFMRRIKGKLRKKAKVDFVAIKNKYSSKSSENMEKEIYNTLWKIDEKSQGCQSNYSSDSGVINFSNMELTGNWRHCFWTIETSSTFEIVFLNFSMNSCEHLIVGNGISLGPIATLSGNILPGSVHIPHTKAYILFMSSCNTKTAQFSLSWNTVALSECNSLLNNDYGEMQYPRMSHYNINGISEATYNNNENCSWIIAASKPLNISFYMHNTEDCCDFLYVRDGNTSKSDLLAILRGSNKTSLITTSSNSVHLQFTTDYSNVGRGFSLSWAVIDQVDECGGTYSTESGSIVHPSEFGSSQYRNNEDCTWIIHSSEPLEIYFTNFNTEACCDHLYIRDGRSKESQLLGRFGGALLPTTLRTTGDAFINFKSDGNVGGTGFILHWNISWQDSVNECNEHLSTDSGIIQYPQEEVNYPDNADCSWVIVTSGPKIELNLTEFSTEACCDFLEIRDGDSNTAPLLGSYSGNTLPMIVRTTTNKAFVRFVSNGSVNKKGFTLTWNTVGCGAVYNKEIGMIRHPEDNNYLDNENCVWIIRAYNHIDISFITFDLENGFDYLYIRDGSSIESPVLGRFTGYHVPPSIKTKTNEAHLSFTSDNSINRAGFELRWNATVCGNEYSSDSGVIQHPLTDGNNYRNEEECTWIIRAANPISITFTRFDTQEGADYLIIRDGETVDSPVLEQYSGSEVPQTIQTSTNAAYIQFSSDGTTTKTGFALQWNANDCGGYFRSDSGEIRYPGNGGHYGNNQDCVWIIETSGPQIEFTFEHFQTETLFDVLYIRDGNNSESELIGELSGSSVTSVRTGNSQAYLRFTSDASVGKDGFIMRWNIAEAEGTADCRCGSLNNLQEIVGGEEVEYGVKYPWHVGLFSSSLVSYYFCGGTLISERYVITAAHCVPDNVLESLQVRIGDHLQFDSTDDIEGVTVTSGIEKVYKHPRFNSRTFDHDFALLRLSKSITFTDGFGIRPICLPSNSSNNYAGELGLSVGWGFLKANSPDDTPNTLHQVEMTILSPECRNMASVTPFMLCAFTEGKDTCQGDSGGSLIVVENGSREHVSEDQSEHYVLVGITSWGIGCAASTPGVYARVTTALDWINRYVVTCDRRGTA